MKLTAMSIKHLAFPVGCVLITLLLLHVPDAPGRVWADGPVNGQLTASEKRGKLIYLMGSSPSGKEITCYLGDATTEVPATAMLCANCHGFDGRGNAEGGVVPSDITWQALTKSYGVTHASGRKHPPYTERAVELAVTKGLDPAGNRLPDTMPRYWMSAEDLADLVAYVKRLGKDQDPGLTETSIKVGALLPAQGPAAEVGQAMKAALVAYFAEVNDKGGIYNRTIEFRAAESTSDSTTARANIERFIDREQPFAMAGAFIAGADSEIISVIEEKEVPLVGPSTLYPETGFPFNRHIFYLFSGLREQSRALVNFAAEKTQRQDPRLVIFYPDSGSPPGVKDAIEEQCKKRQYHSVTGINYSSKSFDPAGLVKRMSEAGTDAIFILRFGDEEAALLKEAEKAKWAPYIFIPGAVAGREILDVPALFKGKVVLSFPTLPSDETREGLLEYRALAERHKLSQRQLGAQFSAYCAAKILVEGLKLSGRELSREKLMKTLEGLYEFDTGLSPRITFGPNRRIGSLGAYMVSIDPERKQFIPVSGWISP